MGRLVSLSSGAIVAAICVSAAAAPAFAAKTTIKWLIGNVKPADVQYVVQQFEKQYPNIKVNALVTAWNELDNKFLAMTAGGQSIDVFSNNSVYGWARYTAKGLFLDLSPYIQRDKKALDIPDFSPLVYNAYLVKGKQISLPTQQYLPNSIAYNATLLGEAGLPLPTTDWSSKDWTWSDMVGYAKKLTKYGANGKPTQGAIDFWDADNLITYAWAMGGDWYDAESYKTGVVKKVVVNSPENVKAYQMLQDLRVVHKVRVGGGNQPFLDGKMPMWMDAQALVDPRLYKKSYKWGLAPFPAMQGNNRDGFAWMEVAAIPSSSKHRAEAWTFVQWLSRQGLTKGFNWPSTSARKSVWDKSLDWWPMEFCALDKAEMSQFMQGAMKHAKVLPRDIVFPSQELYTVIQQKLAKALGGTQDVPMALVAAESAANAELKKFVRK